MKLHWLRLAAAGCAVTVLTAVAFTAVPAHAATTYTPRVGGDVDFAGSSVSFTDDDAGQTLTCTTFNMVGSVAGDGAGSVDSVSSSGCTNPMAGTTTVTPIGTWTIAITPTSGSTVEAMEVSDVDAFISSAGCSFHVGNGHVAGNFDTNTQTFTPTSSTVTITDTPTGFLCQLLGVHQGDSTSVGGSWTNLTPAGSGTDLVGSSILFTDASAAQPISCPMFDLAGSVIGSGMSRSYGFAADSISTVTSSGCRNPTLGDMAITPIGTWTLAITGDASSPGWPAELDNVNATISGAGCTFTIGGKVPGIFDTGSQTFSPSDPATMTITSTPAGYICPLVGWAKGDSFTVAGSWTNTPPAGGGLLAVTNP